MLQSSKSKKQRAHAQDRKRTSPLFAACETLESRRLLAAVNWTGAAADQNWATAGNWSTNSVPGAADDVTINVATNPNIACTGGTFAVKSLNCAELMTISGAATLTVSTTATAS